MTPADLPDGVRLLVERRVSADELRETLKRPLSEDEREETLSLVRWFRRRYPDGAQRLAYARQAYRRWQRTYGPLALEARTRK